VLSKWGYISKKFGEKRAKMNTGQSILNIHSIRHISININTRIRRGCEGIPFHPDESRCAVSIFLYKKMKKKEMAQSIEGLEKKDGMPKK
jgi:hypothetical protein